MPTPYEEIEHTADLCLRVHGSTLEELFEHAAEGMFALMAGSAKQHPISRSFSLASYDREALLVDWLSELLYLSEQHRERYTAFSIHIADNTHLSANVRGLSAYETERGIKAITFSNLEITPTERGFVTTITFDV